MGKGRAPCCDKIGLKKGSWTPAEDMRLMAYIRKHGHGNWRALPKKAGLLRCGKSCRLRWINYLRPDIKRGNFTKEEEDTIIELHHLLGNKWSKIASHLPGRTDNEIKNVWNTHLKKRLNQKDPPLPPSTPSSGSCSSLCEETMSTGGVWPDINNIPDACNMTKQDASEDGIMEISLLSNLETWDILEGQTSSFSSPPTSNTNNDVDRRLLWNMEFNDHLHFHHAPQPPPLTDVGPKPTPSSSPTRISGATVPPQQLEDTKCAFDSQRPTVQATHNKEKSASAAAEADGVEGIGTWIEYLERELDLWCGSDQQSVLTDLVEPPTMTCCEDFDPITSYFHNSPLY